MNFKKQIAFYGLLTILLISNCYFIFKSKNTNSYWYHKKIVWLGTSIPELGYPQMVGKNLEANVVNLAMGSSMVRRGFKIADSINDPIGIKNVNFKSAYRSLIQSPQDKEWIISNWDRMKLLVRNPEKLPQLTDDLKTEIRSSSYIYRLNGNLDADLYVIDQGYNDRYAEYESDSVWHNIPNDSRDKQTFIGAINFLVDYIRTNNPKARIVFIGHYTKDMSNQEGKTDIWEAQDSIANYWSSPICRL